jgi:hypothetical protein
MCPLHELPWWTNAPRFQCTDMPWHALCNK